MKTSECFCRNISSASACLTVHGPAPRPARRAGRDRRPRHVRGGRPRAARDARPRSASGSGRSSPRSGRWSCGARRPCRPTAAGERRCSGWPARPGCCTTRRATRWRTGRGGRVELPVARERRLAGDLVPRRAAEVAGWGRRRAAAARRGPGLLRRPAAQRRGARRGDLRPGRGAGLPVGAARLAALLPGRDPGVRRAVAPRPRAGLGADAGGGLQREGRAPARRPRARAASTARRWSTGCRPRPTSSRRCGSAWAGALVPEPQLRPALAAGSLVALGARGHVDVPLHWQRWRIDSPALDRLTDAVRRSARAHLRR